MTLLTQVGGVIWIAVFGYFKIKKSLWNKKKRLLAFSVTYLLCIALIVPIVAPFNQRRSLPVFEEYIQPHNLGYVLLCRNYVHDDLYNNLVEASKDFETNYGISVTYLDAGFPFIDGFPLLPHLSHNDGRKIDLAFIYQDAGGKTTNDNPSLLGYGVYEEPLQGEVNQPQKCKDAGYWQYDYAKYIGFNTDKELEIDLDYTRYLIENLILKTNASKIFIEPHLAQRINPSSNYRNTIRFHGCHAVRHDDHIHLQISK
ncbi:hypothetical protein LX97_01845 [Nonlabens dokdonensis]|uniref:Transmembrane protein n=2 Tax=Nonlabens dokdonensis TaxID=328515 RepID=A0ABX5PYN5_9FLAO|nr:putative transmembrane protein [Nonlabens dokdonensis DSW-6]PZX41064.1 hypothetical protein LX97_01845 [Nonlabens dokdonensis]